MLTLINNLKLSDIALKALISILLTDDYLFTLSDPYVKVSLIAGGKRLKKRKTTPKRNTFNPIWNEALVFNLPHEHVDNIQVEFVTYNDNLLGNNEAMGKVVIGPNTSGEELAHWGDVMNSKNAMARWHHLGTASDTT